MKKKDWTFYNRNKDNGYFWWFGVFHFFDEVEPFKSKQCVIIWSYRINEDKSKMYANGTLVPNNDQNSGINNPVNGIVAYWYFDGNEIKEDPIKQGQIQLSSQNRSLRLRNTGFEAIDRYQTEITLPNGKLKMKEIDDRLFQLNEFHKIILRYYFNLRAIPKVKVTGKINGEKVEGTGYFQKVSLNSPMYPWLWTNTQFKNGTTLTYLFYPVGNALVRKKQRSRFERFNVYYNKKLKLYIPNHGLEVLSLDGFRKEFRDGLPLFKFKAINKDVRFQTTLTSIARTGFNLQKSNNNSNQFWDFYYNEYPVISKTEDTRLEINGNKINLGYGMGNCEDTWGVIPSL